MINQNDLDKVCCALKDKCPVSNDGHTLIMIKFSNSKKNYFGCAKSTNTGKHYGCYFISGTGRIRRWTKDIFDPLKVIMIGKLIKNIKEKL